jgi:oligoribonuclease
MSYQHPYGTNLAWLDLETTGLDPHADGMTILECGIMITDPLCTSVLGQGAWQFKPPEGFDWSKLDPYVLNMHASSGLIDDCIAAPRTLAECVPTIVDFIRKSGAAKSLMCGSTIGLDRHWLQTHAPDLEKVFHYRNLDASSFMAAMQLRGWDPGEAENKPHRALADVHNSIELYRSAFNYGTGLHAVHRHLDAAIESCPEDLQKSLATLKAARMAMPRPK